MNDDIAPRGHPVAKAGCRTRLLCATILLLSGIGCSASWPAEIEWQAPIEVARGAGQRGEWRQNDSRYDFVDDLTPAWNAQGELALAWVDQRRKAVLLQRYSADGRALPASPVDVSRQPASFSWLPRLAWAPDDAARLHVLWQEIIFSGGSHGGEMMSAVSADGGRTFAEPVNLSRSTAGDGKGRINAQFWHNGSFDIATAPGGRVFAAWTEYDGRLWFAGSMDAGRSFGRPLLVAGEPPARPARAPALAIAKDGTVVLAWTSGENASADIQVARSTDAGRTFGAPIAAAVTSGYSDAPKLAFDPGGTLHLVHGESLGGPFGVSAIRHLRSTDAGRSFGRAQEISHPLPGGHSGAAFPSLGIDATGRVVVTWELMQGRAQSSSAGLGIAVANDGKRFGAPQVIPGSADPGGGRNGSTQGLLMNKLAVRGDGEIAVASSAVKPGSHSRVWLLRGVLRP